MSDMVEFKFTVNDKPVTLQADPDRSVLEILREDLQLTGAKYGCGEGAPVPGMYRSRRRQS